MRTLTALTIPLFLALVGAPRPQDTQTAPKGTLTKAVPGATKTGPTYKDEPGFRVDCDDYATVRPSDQEIWKHLGMVGISMSEALDIATAYAQDEQGWEEVKVTKAELVPSPNPYYEIELLTRKEKEDGTTGLRRWQLYVGKSQMVRRWLVRERFPGTPVRGEVTELPSGLMTYEIEEGDGERLEKDAKVRVHYRSATLNGMLLVDTRQNRSPEEWDLSTHPVRGLSEGLVGARVGGRRKLIIPPELAYKDRGLPAFGIPPNATMIYDVEILRVE